MKPTPNGWKLKASDTNLEASKSKKSAVDYGYLKDDFIQYFVEEKPKREVIMRIGYYVRCFSFQQIFSKFLINGRKENGNVIF
jgi:hypothetical protein